MVNLRFSSTLKWLAGGRLFLSDAVIVSRLLFAKKKIKNIDVGQMPTVFVPIRTGCTSSSSLGYMLIFCISNLLCTK